MFLVFVMSKLFPLKPQTFDFHELSLITEVDVVLLYHCGLCMFSETKTNAAADIGKQGLTNIGNAVLRGYCTLVLK